MTYWSQMAVKSKWLVEGDMTGKGNYLFESNDRKEQLISRSDKTGKIKLLVEGDMIGKSD